MELMMSDLKSKLPDLKELGEITGKLYKDIKQSVCEIISSYKKNHPDTESVHKEKPAKKTAASDKAKSDTKHKE